ncbi:hypothetical protein GUITHDRAFT_106529 [Guillardia theta CCMP2712]|uniref:Uncharacterized protein n=2 Tax=Guillardia theta TaxID=55529 RepID=L1JGT1_GUITC|nr:hypothetical protein GUITHDRAFT_106529 [Guillardia theta CCMP2712]EKX47542.1 hypothetical protein GUITHDRAFT_106529 [Guillardia theta CCMP2712]|eukprot:XP_005834522.1 hypothetical protein GUITHDRAFT_106529 [Guillardia theta CCMP2712]
MSGKGGKVDDDGNKLKMKRVKESVEKHLHDVQVTVDNALLNKLYDSQGWARPNGPEEAKETMKLVFAGEVKEDGKREVDNLNPLAIKQLGRSLKEVCPLHCRVKSICFWHSPVEDEGLKGLLEFGMKPPKPDVWEGLLHLELVDCGIGLQGCELLGESLKAHVPLRSLTLDFNHFGDAGVEHIASGLRNNTNVSTLSLAFCGLTSRSGQLIADGIIKGSKVKSLDLKGNKLGLYIDEEGNSLPGYSLIPIFAGMTNQELWAPTSVRQFSSDKQDEDGNATNLWDLELKAVLSDEFRAQPMEGTSGNYRATQGPWAGWELFTSYIEGEPKLFAATETLQKLNLCDNSFTEDITYKVMDKNGTQKVVQVDESNFEVSLACPLEKEETWAHLKQDSFQVFRAQITKGCYCQMGMEMIHVTDIVADCAFIIREDLDAVKFVLPLQSLQPVFPSAGNETTSKNFLQRYTPVSERQLFELGIVKGACLHVGREIIRIRSISGGSVFLSRGSCGTEVSKHAQGVKAIRLCQLGIQRGTCFSPSTYHELGDSIQRISQFKFMVKQLSLNVSLEELLLENNLGIGQDAAELLRVPTRRLSVFTLSGNGIKESLFREVYKDGTSSKKGKKKK